MQTCLDLYILKPTSLGFGPALATSSFFVKSKLNLEQMFDLSFAWVEYYVTF